MRKKITIGLVTIIIPYIIVLFVYYLFKHYVHGVSFAQHRDGLGATLASYSGTMIAILIAAMTFLLGSNTDKLRKIRRYGYMTSVVIVYALCFVELGILFFIGLLLMSSIEGFMLTTISFGVTSASFIHIALMMCQLYNLTKD